ncbi:MAG TPA: M28 family peptidase [Candidatus Acidoferrum sp.]|nr:M28 family peptidase [Candidatus Acidoferrum sp.]
MSTSAAGLKRDDGVGHSAFAARNGRRALRLILGLVLVTAACARPVPQAMPAGSPTQGAALLSGASAADLLGIVGTLAGPEMEGRATGSPGMVRAARYIATAFQRAGLLPAGDGGSYFQAFDVVTGIHLGEQNRLHLQGAAGGRDYQVSQDFTPFSFSDSGRVQGEVAFVGYGITAPDLRYDDYAGVDVAGRIVLVLSGDPRERDTSSPFRRPEAYRYTEVRYKVLNAREHGARGVILVTNPVAHGEEPERLFAIRGITSVSQSGILAINALRRVADAVLAGSGHSLRELQEAIDRDLRPHSFVASAVTTEIAVQLIHEHGQAWNVIGLLRGTDPALREQAVVVGAHYDHLGHGGETSLAPERYGEIHPGADDNASGVAGVIGLARVFAAEGGARRTVIFMAFAGEEMGLLGSSHYVRAPAIPLEHTVAMLNMDMIGRLRNDTLYVFGVDTGKEFREELEAANRDVGLTFRLSGDGYGPSDHTPFYSKNLPVLFFFTGPHPDYHRPSDTPDKINASGLSRVVRLMAGVLRRIAGGSAPVTFVRVERSSPLRPSAERGQGYGPYFGLIPEFGLPDDGVRLNGVLAGSPAEKAGLRTGDLIVRFDGRTVRNLEDFVFVLRGKRAGDEVEVVYRRGTEEHTVGAVLGVRP